MFKAIKEFFVGKPNVDAVAPGAAPYKVESPSPVVAEVAAVQVETVASFSTVVSEGTAPVTEKAINPETGDVYDKLVTPEAPAPVAKPKRTAKPKAPAAKPAKAPKAAAAKAPAKAKSKKA